MKYEKHIVTLIVYVDDILLVGTDQDKITEIKQFLDNEVTIKDMGHADFFPGIEIHQSIGVLTISQNKYILDILQEACLLDSNSAITPLPIGCKVHKVEGNPLVNPEQYRILLILNSIRESWEDFYIWSSLDLTCHLMFNN